jgi:hypothetical protein
MEESKVGWGAGRLRTALWAVFTCAYLEQLTIKGPYKFHSALLCDKLDHLGENVCPSGAKAQTLRDEEARDGVWLTSRRAARADSRLRGQVQTLRLHQLTCQRKRISALPDSPNL